MFNHYVDLADEPSTLQKRPSVPTSFEKSKNPSLYENERDQHTNAKTDNVGKLNAVRDSLYAPNEVQSKLCSPLSKREEITKLKTEME